MRVALTSLATSRNVIPVEKLRKNEDNGKNVPGVKLRDTVDENAKKMTGRYIKRSASVFAKNEAGSKNILPCNDDLKTYP
mmetsp:Transcript_350/g.465  ORF Transcript_350/g.465 Transcript_350/m.465 type:complete len:80 (+) Transcript_350:961-1200(+)